MSYYKYLGFTSEQAWNQWIIVTGLRPGIDAREFFKEYGFAIARDRDRSLPNGWRATHYDYQRRRFVQITTGPDGVHYLIWDDGSKGSNPPKIKPSNPRFEAIDVYQAKHGKKLKETRS